LRKDICRIESCAFRRPHPLSCIAQPYSAGRRTDCNDRAETSLARRSGDRDATRAFMSFSRDRGDFVAALEYAEQLARLSPNDHSIARIVDVEGLLNDGLRTPFDVMHKPIPR
jgi:hypothetical protein